MNTITLNLSGLPGAHDIAVELIRVEADRVIVRGYLGNEEPYSLETGKRLETNWDLWRVGQADLQKLRQSVARNGAERKE